MNYGKRLDPPSYNGGGSLKNEQCKTWIFEKRGEMDHARSRSIEFGIGLLIKEKGLRCYGRPPWLLSRVNRSWARGGVRGGGGNRKLRKGFIYTESHRG